MFKLGQPFRHDGTRKHVVVLQTGQPALQAQSTKQVSPGHQRKHPSSRLWTALVDIHPKQKIAVHQMCYPLQSPNSTSASAAFFSLAAVAVHVRNILCSCDETLNEQRMSEKMAEGNWEPAGGRARGGGFGRAPCGLTFMSWFQCRSRIAGWCRSDTSGRLVSIAFTASSNSLHALQLSVLAIRCADKFLQPIRKWQMRS